VPAAAWEVWRPGISLRHRDQIASFAAKPLLVFLIIDDNARTFDRRIAEWAAINRSREGGDRMSVTLDDAALLETRCLINGRWISAREGQGDPVRNPANGEIIAHVPALGRLETHEAIEAAVAAYPAWRGLTAKERSNLLRAWFGLVMVAREDLARILTVEQGKPLSEARSEVAYGAAFLEWFAEEAKRAYGEIVPGHDRDKRILVMREPIGVVAAITPWNFPLAMVTRKLAPALAAGCTVVLKPAPQTPLSALALAHLAERAGMPPGVLNVVTGPAEPIGAEMTANPKVRKLAFTGSTATGKILMAQCAGTVKKLSLELGGNAPFIVFDDADLDAAIAGAMASKYRNTGQTCVCANRFLVQAGIYREFTARLVAKVRDLKVGPGMEAGVEQGPLIDERALAKVESHVADALAKGGRLETGGRRHSLGGTFFEPTVLSEATEAMVLAQEETFGPVAALFRFSDAAQAIAMANATASGLAAYLYTRDYARILLTAEALEYGIVGVNTGIISTEVAPFGGMKESGVGREGSRHGLDDYLELKYVCLGGVTS
jgi:succinate-semialdehyde dehydrogenase/glutarate-semialdehyde dehydrogenase